MAVTLLEAGDLVAMLHRGTLGSTLWSDFLAGVSRRIGADRSVIIIRSGRDEPRFTIVQQDELPRHTSIAPDASANLLRSGRVYRRSELKDIGLAMNRQPLGDVVDAKSPGHMRVMRVEIPTGPSLWIIAQRKGQDFSAADSALIASLADHLGIALHTWSTLERERLRAGITGEAIRRLNFGWVMLDPVGRILDQSDEAEALLQKGTGLQRSPAGKLVPIWREAQGSLRLFLEDMRKGETQSRAIHLSDEPWLDMLLTTAKGTMRERASGPVIVAYIHGEQPGSSERASQLRELFGLTETEAQLALMISRGVKIAEAAPQLNITVETARLYSKRIYAKTSTRGQADLVRLILASIVALG